MGGRPARLADRGADALSYLPPPSVPRAFLEDQVSGAERERRPPEGLTGIPRKLRRRLGRAGRGSPPVLRAPPASRRPLPLAAHPDPGAPVGGDKPEPCLARGSASPTDPGSALQLTTPPNPEAASAVSANISFASPNPTGTLVGNDWGSAPRPPPLRSKSPDALSHTSSNSSRSRSSGAHPGPRRPLAASLDGCLRALVLAETLFSCGARGFVSMPAAIQPRTRPL
ncbi:hypothetical protein PAL_GLEAN10016968 [Pteropus alecto]|uniref:Uncharacterized protein n=1 Tax=Pteropus alecto TaxID=9402 RepID=L5JV38_PTEAL|nr:hypothetical protein PAL_GLEAN10016968 [Pteropus alecto]